MDDALFLFVTIFCENVEWGRGVKLNSLFWRLEEKADRSRELGNWALGRASSLILHLHSGHC